MIKILFFIAGIIVFMIILIYLYRKSQFYNKINSYPKTKKELLIFYSLFLLFIILELYLHEITTALHAENIDYYALILVWIISGALFSFLVFYSIPHISYMIDDIKNS
ncbi:hypothetical protein [Tenacibaculum ovolyticum]|uniref:hypothetical protein n=1 Tax=Tenacibaculum ovolyticum TaxID=104270 RepID=UPI0007ED9B70|nr:hypothetical protein [Tenacibaculum ovolyticum]